MSYLVMARKWRPKNFDEMVGQEHVARTLRNAIESGRIAHAFLFTGTRGVGKTTSARILAKALNCKKGPTPTPCETCENCLAVNRGDAMDVLEIDGASNNGVENVRELREQVKYAPMQGAYKVYIIDEVHMLSKSAFNALLKTLEEPPPHVIFIFATTEANKVPHTILSRVQRFDFKRIPESAIRERLEFICGKEDLRPEREALEAVARKADGSMRDALSLFDRVVAFSGVAVTLEAARKVLGIPEDRLYDGLLRGLIARSATDCFKALEEVYQQGLEVSDFLLGFGEFLRDLLFSRQEGITPALLGLGEARFAELRSLTADLQDGDLLRYAKIISDLLSSLKYAPHPRLMVELTLARMAALDRVVTLSQLLGQETPPTTTPGPAPEIPEAKKKSPEPEPAPLPQPLEHNAVGEGQGAVPEPGRGMRVSPGRWTDLVEEYAQERPFTASPLRHSRLRVEEGESPTLEVIFSDPHQHDLFLADKQNKSALRAYLAGKLEPASAFALTFSIAPAPPTVPPPGGTVGGAAVNGESLENQPIVKTLLDMFEGRVLDVTN